MDALLQGLLVGVIGGLAAGALGVSPGGIIVPIAIFVLGCGQHVAQLISLTAQIAPTSLSALARYKAGTHAAPGRWLVPLTLGFIAGGLVGASFAGSLSDQMLQGIYVGYLGALEILLLISLRHKKSGAAQGGPKPGTPALLIIGLIAGVSSGLMGIGGGLAVTVGLGTIVRVGQHRAQAASLSLSLLPLTLPAVWLYSRQGVAIPWLVVAGVILGLFLGTDLGARCATRLYERWLKWGLIAVVLIFALYMASRAARSFGVQ